IDPDFVYDPLVCEFQLVTDQQVVRAIAKLSAYKAPGLNGVSNIVLMKCAESTRP
ncbi:hypothetical protein P692DRAFT_20691382, partial [Suillus brevipes Sb2]